MSEHQSDQASLVPQAGPEVRIPDGKYAIVNLDQRRPLAMKPKTSKDGEYYYIVGFERNEYEPEQWEVLWDSHLVAHSFRNVRKPEHWMGVVPKAFENRPTLVVSTSRQYFRVQEATQNGTYYIVPTSLVGKVADLARYGNNSEIICWDVNPGGGDPWQQWQFVAIGKTLEESV